MRSSKAPLNVDQWQRLDSARDGITVAYTYKQKLNQARRLARKGCRNNKLEVCYGSLGYFWDSQHGSAHRVGFERSPFLCEKAISQSFFRFRPLKTVLARHGLLKAIQSFKSMVRACILAPLMRAAALECFGDTATVTI